MREAAASGEYALPRIEGSWHRTPFDGVAGFEASVVVATSPAIGIRESRRIHGDYVLTRQDVLGARRFDDEIALCGAPIEDHHAGGDTDWQYVHGGGVYGVPYRTLLPAGLEWFLVARRGFTSTHDAHASARSMATCMAMGQAAGTAAVMAAAGGTVPRRVPADMLRERLALDGVLLDPVEAGEGVLASSGGP